jgi:hypothetical protein
MIMTVYIPKLNSKHLSGDDTKWNNEAY